MEVRRSSCCPAVDVQVAVAANTELTDLLRNSKVYLLFFPELFATSHGPLQQMGFFLFAEQTSSTVRDEV